MHTNEQTKKQKAWEFVSVFPENEKGTYGRRIAESKWQSQTTSPPPQNVFHSQPRPNRSGPRSPILGRNRPCSSPEVVATRANYQPPQVSRHTIESSQPCSQTTNVIIQSQVKPRTPPIPQRASQHQQQHSPRTPSMNMQHSPSFSHQQRSPQMHSQQQQQHSPRTPSMNMQHSPSFSHQHSPQRSTSQTFTSFFTVNKPTQATQSKNLYEQMRVDDEPSYYSTTPPTQQSYYGTNSMSSSVIGSKSSCLNLSRTCPLSSSDPSVQKYLFAENERQQGNNY